jgi:putative PIN family toxin of toxin-antitoxin system
VVKGKKVVIDTNVFISAFGWGGKPLRIIELLEKGEIRNCISEEILIELCSALAYPKINFP